MVQWVSFFGVHMYGGGVAISIILYLAITGVLIVVIGALKHPTILILYVISLVTEVVGVEQSLEINPIDHRAEGNWGYGQV
jgi:hypothetical protein